MEKTTSATYKARNFDSLLGIKGFSDQLLQNHFTLYQGYVNSTNKLINELAEFLKNGDNSSPQFAELKRRFGWEFNGMKLHEYYFENLSKNGREINRRSNLFRQITMDFGSFEKWEKDFRGMGAMRGIGWVILYYDPIIKKLFNVWCNEHDVGHLVGAVPLLVMDVFEHAYLNDYGLKRADYIETFCQSMNCAIICQRFDQSFK